MKMSFYEFIESKNNEDSDILNLIRSGNNLRKNDCGSFWDDFINLCGNSNAMSKLLDIPKEKITGLAGKINEFRQLIKNKDSNSKNRVLRTGE